MHTLTKLTKNILSVAYMAAESTNGTKHNVQMFCTVVCGWVNKESVYLPNLCLFCFFICFLTHCGFSSIFWMLVVPVSSASHWICLPVQWLGFETVTSRHRYEWCLLPSSGDSGKGFHPVCGNTWCGQWGAQHESALLQCVLSSQPERKIHILKSFLKMSNSYQLSAWSTYWLILWLERIFLKIVYPFCMWELRTLITCSIYRVSVITEIICYNIFC